MNQRELEVNWISPPGETILSLVKSRSVDFSDLSTRLNLGESELCDLIHGRICIDAELARRLSEMFGTTSDFWTRREVQFRSDLEALAKHKGREWLKKLPLKDMAEFGWVSRSTGPHLLLECLSFFGCYSLADWHYRYSDPINSASYRRSLKSSHEDAAVASWLRRGELLARAESAPAWNPEKLRELIPSIRRLTRVHLPQQFMPELKRLCLQCGVVLVTVRPPKKCPISGAARFLDSTTPVIQLSFRYKWDDQFWFTFFHEVGHLLLHPKERMHLDTDVDTRTIEEVEANEFASSVLIPADYSQHLRELSTDVRSIVRFATKVGVSPGIVVGQLQHLGRLPFSRMNGLKRQFNWIS